MPLKQEVDYTKLRAKSVSKSLTGSAVSNSFYLHQQNRKYVRYMLARMTQHVEESIGMTSDFAEYARGGKFDIEHVLPENEAIMHDDFESADDFYQERERFAGLLLLPKSVNRSLQAKPYEEKLTAYFGENILARSLNKQCYQNNPQFNRFIRDQALQFEAQSEFGPRQLDKRGQLYQSLCELIWSPKRLFSL